MKLQSSMIIFFNLGKYSKCTSKMTKCSKRKTFQSSIPVQWIVTADKDQTSAWYMGVKPPSYNHAAIYETSDITLTSVNASNNRNLQGINAGRSIIAPTIACACPMHSHVYLWPHLYTTNTYVTCTYADHTYNTVIVGPYSRQLCTTTRAIFHTQGSYQLTFLVHGRDTGEIQLHRHEMVSLQDNATNHIKLNTD